MNLTEAFGGFNLSYRLSCTSDKMMRLPAEIPDFNARTRGGRAGNSTMVEQEDMFG